MMPTEPNAVNTASMPSNLPKSQTDLLITTLPAPANSLTGTELSLPGLATLKSLAQQKPTAEQANRQLLASLQSDLSSQIDIVETTNKDYEVTGYRITLKSPLSESWLKAIDYYTQPARSDMVVAEVSRLRTLTAKRKENEFDLELSIGAITEELRGYPEDIVRSVCRDWARGNIFFPVLKELLDKCEEHMKLRRAIMQASHANKLISTHNNLSQLVSSSIKRMGAA